MPQTVALTNEQKVTATIAPVTATGHPAPVDGSPTWAVQSGNATIEPAADGLSCVIKSPDTVTGSDESVITVSADADLGEGVTTISDSITVTTTQAQAAALGVTVGAPEPK